jgi:hypothetical protein
MILALGHVEVNNSYNISDDDDHHQGLSLSLPTRDDCGAYVSRVMKMEEYGVCCHINVMFSVYGLQTVEMWEHFPHH